MRTFTLTVMHPTSRIRAALMVLRLIAAVRQGEIRRAA